MSNVRKYSEIQHQAAFLFPADTLKALNKYSLELARMREMSPPKVPVFDDPNAIKYIVQQDKVHEAYANLESRIQGHLTLIDHDHSLWRSLCDRIDRLEARSNEDARKRMGLDSGP
jgi:ABC-type branched-subunit amino acid transport system ATPase component